MKKLIVTLACTLFVMSLFADNTRCVVPNSGGAVVELEDISATPNEKGELAIFTRVVQNAQVGSADVYVNVNIYDALTNTVVDVVTVKTPLNGKMPGKVYRKGFKPGHAYYYRIHSASCDR